jgi:F0F1-type ATP synthase assembly protein I
MSESRNTASGGRGQSLRLAAVAIEFFSTILGLLVLGYSLDTYLHTTPWLGASGVVLGLAIGVYRLIVGLRHLDR